MRSAFVAACLAMALCGHGAEADVLDKIAETGRVQLGVRGAAPPFSYLDFQTEPAGLAVRLCEEVAARIGAQLGIDEIEIDHGIVTASTRFGALGQGLTDIHCGPASVTLKRRETLDFSLLYFVDGAAVAERPGGYDALLANQTGKIGVLDGTTAVAVAQGLIETHGLDAEIEAFASHPRGLTALRDGKIDIYVGDHAILLFQVSNMDEAGGVTVRDEILSFEPYALAVRGGERRLLLAIDRALSDIYRSGLIFDLIRQELGSFEIPPQTRAIYKIVGLPD
ncbi:MAG: transporter substrate-binding domain-containing protein [Pseudomonadota bacterium]